MVRVPNGGTKFFLGVTWPAKRKIKQPFHFRTSNFVYILAIVNLVPVTEKGFLKCFVGKMGCCF